MNKEPQQSDLSQEFSNLGENLKEAMRTIWESEERVRVQEEIEAGLSELTAKLKEAGDEIIHGPTGEQMKSEVKDLRDRVQSGEAQQHVRSEILEALRKINAELKSLIDQ